MSSSTGLSSCISAASGLKNEGEAPLPVEDDDDADNAAEVAELDSDTARAVGPESTGAGGTLGEVRGETFLTGRDNLEPPDVLATVFGPPVAALPGLEAREEGVDSGESRFTMDGMLAGGTGGFVCSLSEIEPSEAELADSEASLAFGICFTVLAEDVVLLAGCAACAWTDATRTTGCFIDSGEKCDLMGDCVLTASGASSSSSLSEDADAKSSVSTFIWWNCLLAGEAGNGAALVLLPDLVSAGKGDGASTGVV